MYFVLGLFLGDGQQTYIFAPAYLLGRNGPGDDEFL